MRLIYFVQYFLPEKASGLQLVEDLLEGLAAHGWDVDLYTPTPTRGVTKDVYKRQVERRLSMKKILCLVLALLCLSAYAMAESVPSKNTSDMVSVEIDATSNPDLPVDSGLVVLPVLEEDEAHAIAYAEPIALCQEEIAKLAENVAQSEESAETSGVEAYFGEVHDSEGNVVVLSEALAAQTLDVFEFMPLIVRCV